MEFIKRLQKKVEKPYALRTIHNILI